MNKKRGNKIMKISDQTYNNIVNEVIRVQKVAPFKDTLEIIKETLRDYELHLKDLSENELNDLFFQLTYSLINSNR